MFKKTLNISTSPHIVKGLGTNDIMRNVVWAMLPTAFFAVYAFGLSALLLLVTSTAACVLTEYFLAKKSKQPSTISDWSAVITGLLLGLTLPPNFPLWMAFLGGIVSIALGKFVFGGLGYNVFNPALVGRAFLQAAFPVAITTWFPVFSPDRFTTVSMATFTLPFMKPATDGFTGATPLAAFKFDHVSTGTYDLAMGFITGSTGETCALLIILGGIYLAVRKMMNWHIPVSILATVYVLTAILHYSNPEKYPTPEFMLFSGGLMLGAVFMATDMVGSPITTAGVWIYGALIGILVVVIRIWGGLPEGVMYAILLANAVSLHLDNLIKPRVYGTTKTLDIRL